MKLYDYWRSSAAYRVRIALNLNGQAYEHICVHLVKDGGQQHSADYKAKNPQGFIPALELEDGTILSQSMAILEYLDETTPEPAFLPASPKERAIVRSLAQIITSDIHPVNNLRILQYLAGELGVEDEPKMTWYRHWITKGFDALEARLGDDTFCFGDTPTLADICLVPQVYNAHRFKVDMTPYPKIARINETCLKLEAFQKAVPENQPDAV
ncbi:putative maleylacetoacetate isomerase [Candidatus Terasakiella magnetica]|uniref:Putative maleylacetoacetate isomerase n=1 Tax=Candidatus Terasakiella magnetica TaxID=1867952 RepID=A0A1C3RDY2_9PROT|nr:maleylacetoacetate isomerase [Candidatus Terasakiella magnetica]SCA55507.1 putative maleylacetoacetate isomerase [Candidatus Terasakiella magnetica]